MLTIDDTDYIKSTFTGLKTLDLTNADFIDNQGDGKNNSIWVHPWKGNTADIEHQFPDCAFQNNKTLETLIFGSKIKSIGAFAFSGCTSLKEIRFVNSSLEAIDNDGVWHFLRHKAYKRKTTGQPASIVAQYIRKLRGIDSGRFESNNRNWRSVRQ